MGMMTVALDQQGSEWGLTPKQRGGPFSSSDPDTLRVWWTDVGVHQNLTHAVHPDPISGQHCWHQAVRVGPAQLGDSQGDVFVDTRESRAMYEKWLEMTRSADDYSPDGTLIAVAGYHEVLLHNADGSGLAARLIGLSERVQKVKFSNDGKKLAVAGGLPARSGEIQIWNVGRRSCRCRSRLVTTRCSA